MKEQQKATASSDVVAGGTTGATVQNTGPYRISGPIDITVFLARGDKFPGSPFPAATTASASSMSKADTGSTWTMITEPTASEQQ